MNRGFLERSVDGELARDHGYPTFVSIWEALPAKTPLTGATVTVPETARAVYLEVSDMRFTARVGGASTVAGGMVAIYANQVVEITIQAPGHMPRKMLVGGNPQYYSTAIAVLTRI